MRDPFDIERAAHRRLPRMIVDFIAGGTGAETGEIRNRAALDAVTLQARALVNVETVSLETELLGERWRRPYGIAPMGMCDVVWPGADAALSAEAAARCMPHAVSTAASTPLEQTFADAGGNAWFQLYAGEDDALTFEFVSRARDAGYRMLLFTVDTPRHSRRTRDLENGFAVPFRWSPRTLADVLTHPRWALAMLQNGTPRPMNYETSPTCRAFARYESRGRSDWAFLDRLRAAWP
ncbi:MAG: alpha-hydroxy acid oxidase, partial [Pseudomonadota bacterium]